MVSLLEAGRFLVDSSAGISWAAKTIRIFAVALSTMCGSLHAAVMTMALEDQERFDLGMASPWHWPEPFHRKAVRCPRLLCSHWAPLHLSLCAIHSTQVSAASAGACQTHFGC